MSKLIGTGPNQVPTNADLGTMAYQDSDRITVKQINVNNGSQSRIHFESTHTNAKHWSITNEGNVNRLRFMYTDDAQDTNAQPTMYITSDKRLGIATSSSGPRATLEVGNFNNTSGLVTEQLFISGRYVGGDGTFAQIRLSNSSDAGGDFAEIGARREGDNYGTRLYFATNPRAQTNSLTTRMVIDDQGNVGIGTQTPDYRLTINGGTSMLGLQLSETDRLTMGADGTWNYYAAQSGNSHRFTTSASGTVLDINNGGDVHVDADINGNEPVQRGRLRILNAGGETSSGGLEFHTSNAGGAGYGARITADTSGRMYIQTRSNASSWTTQQTFDASGFGSEIEGYDFTSGTTNLAPPIGSDLWSSISFNTAVQTYTTASFNNRTARVIRLQNPDNTAWNFFRYDGYSTQEHDYSVPGSENYAVFEFWSKNNGGSSTGYRGFIAEGDVWQGSPSRTSASTVIYTNADGWSLNRTVMLMQDAYKLNFGFGFDYNRSGADMYFAFPSFYFASGKRGSMQAGIPIAMDGNNGRLQISRRGLQIGRGGQVSASVAGRHFVLSNNNWTTFGYLYSAQNTPLLIRALAGHNSYGTYDDFINDTYAYNIADGTTVTIGNTSTGSTYSIQLRKIKRTNITDNQGRTLVGGGDGGWEYQIARNQSHSMKVYLQISGVNGTAWAWQKGDDA